MASAYAVYSLQDVQAKWLVRTLPVWQVVFFKGIVISILVIATNGARTVAAVRASQNKFGLALRGFINFAATLFFFLATRHMGLADATTILFVAPVLVVALSMLVLREEVSATRWAVVGLGLTGAVIAINPTGQIDSLAALFALSSAFFWALGVVLIRKISASEAIGAQMLTSNVVVAALSSVALLWSWSTPDAYSLMLLIGVGASSGLGQYLLYKALQQAPASLLAPVEYSSLVWAFMLGYIVFGDVPASNVYFGAALIVGSSVTLILTERKSKSLVG